MKSLLVIHEKDLEDNEKTVIGVADSVENAEEMIKKYYGEFEEISRNDIQDSGLEYSKVLEVKTVFANSYRVEVCLEWFCVNSL